MVVRLVHFSEQPRYQELMREHHYLGHLPKIGETLWYVASRREQWVALLSFSASALKCAARDRWIGWSFCHQYARLKLVVNNSRFLILPVWHLFNLGSRVLSLCQRRLPRDRRQLRARRGVAGNLCRPAASSRDGVSGGELDLCRKHAKFSPDSCGIHGHARIPQDGLSQLLRADARRLLCRAILFPPYHLGGTTMRLTAEQMRSLPYFFSQLPDPRRTQGRRHRLSTVLGIAAGAVLCGMRGYKAIADSAPKPRAEIAGTLWLPSRTGPLCGAQQVHPPQRANSRHARRSGSRLAMLERTLSAPGDESLHGHRRQDPVQRPG